MRGPSREAKTFYRGQRVYYQGHQYEVVFDGGFEITLKFVTGRTEFTIAARNRWKVSSTPDY